MERSVARVLAATAAVLLLLGLGRTAAAVDTAGPLTAASVGHDAVALGIVAGSRTPATHPGTKTAAVTSAPPAGPAPTAPGARETTDGTSRTPPPHLAASTGDRAPPALP